MLIVDFLDFKNAEGRVYKMHLAKHKWSPGSTQCGWGSNNLCSCFGDGVEDLTFDPEVYDLTNDPYEDKPISSESTELVSLCILFF